MMFLKKKNKEQKKYIETVKEAGKNLMQGKQNYLPIVYQDLVAKDKSVVSLAATIIGQYMSKLDSNHVIRLDEQFRQYSSMEWYISWEKVDVEILKKKIESYEDYLWVLRLGTFHPNGYFREKCIRKLENDRDSLPFLLLRLNDWVPVIREIAEIICLRIIQCSDENIVRALPCLIKVMQGQRKRGNVLDELEECVANKIHRLMTNLSISDLKKYELVSRKYMYQLIVKRKLLTKEKINQILKSEKNGQCQALLVTMLLTYYEVSIEELDVYLICRSKIVQRKALEKKYSMVGDYWSGLEELLLSDSKGVRELVCYILRKHTQIDIVEYYKKNLQTNRRKICVLGIGENGKTDDAEFILDYLKDEEECVVKNTLHAVSLLLGDKAADIFWAYLQDEHPVIMRAAYREVAANDICFGAKKIYELFQTTDSEILKEKLAYQFLREYSWERLPYVLKLYWYKDEDIRSVIQRSAHRRNIYGQISKESAEQIRRIMYNEKYCIPKELQEQIEFDLKYVVKK